MNGINSKHHAAGTDCPEINAEKITFVNMRFCPFAQRTALVLIAKNVP